MEEGAMIGSIAAGIQQLRHNRQTLMQVHKHSNKQSSTPSAGSSDVDGSKKLFTACYNGSAEDVRAVLFQSPSIALSQIRSDDGSTPLHVAARRGLPEVLQILLNHLRTQGVMPSTALNTWLDGDGCNTVLHAIRFSSRSKLTAVFHVIRGAGGRFDLSESTERGWRALDFAVYFNRFEVIRFLIDAGCEPTALSTSDKTAFHTAIEFAQGFQALHELIIGFFKTASYLFLCSGSGEGLTTFMNELSKFADNLGDICCQRKFAVIHTVLVKRSLKHVTCEPDITFGESTRPIAAINDSSPKRDVTPFIDKDTRDAMAYPANKLLYRDSSFVWRSSVTLGKLRLKNPRCCTCKDICVPGKCECMITSSRSLFDDHGRLLPIAPSSVHPDCFPAYTIECNELCSCNQRTCATRVMQDKTNRPRLELFLTPTRGWGVKTLQTLKAGTVVATMEGVVQNKEDIRHFDEHNTMYSMNFPVELHHRSVRCRVNLDHEPQPVFVVQCLRYGNVGRFLNHSCAPNCVVRYTYTQPSYDANAVTITMVTAKDVNKETELTWDYGSDFWMKEDGRHCRCNSQQCVSKIANARKKVKATVSTHAEEEPGNDASFADDDDTVDRSIIDQYLDVAAAQKRAQKRQIEKTADTVEKLIGVANQRLVATPRPSSNPSGSSSNAVRKPSWCASYTVRNVGDGSAPLMVRRGDPVAKSAAASHERYVADEKIMTEDDIRSDMARTDPTRTPLFHG